MSRTREAAQEERVQRLAERTYRCLTGGLATAVSYTGGHLLGISIKYTEDDILLTLRAEFPGGRMVCFVGAADLARGFVKATREAGKETLRWRADRYSRKD